MNNSTEVFLFPPLKKANQKTSQPFFSFFSWKKIWENSFCTASHKSSRFTPLFLTHSFGSMSSSLLLLPPFLPRQICREWPKGRDGTGEREGRGGETVVRACVSVASGGGGGGGGKRRMGRRGRGRRVWDSNRLQKHSVTDRIIPYMIS